MSSPCVISVKLVWVVLVLGWGCVGSSIATCISSDLFRVHIYLGLALWEGPAMVFERGRLLRTCRLSFAFDLIFVWLF